MNVAILHCANVHMHHDLDQKANKYYKNQSTRKQDQSRIFSIYIHIFVLYFKKQTMDLGNRFLNKTIHPRALFYLLTPNELAPSNNDIPYDLERYMGDIFTTCILLEMLYLTIIKKIDYNFADATASISTSVFLLNIQSLGMMCFHYKIYDYFYENFRILEISDFQENFFKTWPGWFFCIIFIEFSSYWYHRLSHEINFFWSFHQVHHSSQHYILPTALRQSAWHQYLSNVEWWLLAFIGIPSPVAKMHRSANLLYQFWVHTDTVDKCPWIIEIIFNTPSHHRVHHGRNKDCIDCNYGGFLILFDRIFGTFKPEHAYKKCKSIDDKGQVISGKSEDIAFGLVSNVETFGIFHVQHYHLRNVLKDRFWFNFKNGDFLKAFRGTFYGPGYNLDHGASEKPPRLGKVSDIPEIEKPLKIYIPSTNQDYKLQFYCIYITFLVTKHIEACFDATLIGQLYLVTMQSVYLEISTGLLDGRYYSTKAIVAFQILYAVGSWMFLKSGFLFYGNLGAIFMTMSL